MSIESDEYLAFSNIINEFISANMLAMDLTVNSYNYNYLWEEVAAKGINIRSFPFERSARRSISGMIVRDSYETTLAYNANMSIKRKNFTISHEFTHFLYHLNDENNMFTDTKETLAYSLADILPEFQANIGASSILLPEPVLVNELKKGLLHISFPKHMEYQSKLYICVCYNKCKLVSKLLTRQHHIQRVKL